MQPWQQGIWSRYHIWNGLRKLGRIVHVCPEENVTLTYSNRCRFLETFKINYLCHLTKSSAFFTEVNDHSTSTLLRFFDCFLDAIDKIWSAGADVGSEHVTSVALAFESGRRCSVLLRRNGGLVPRHALSELDGPSHQTFSQDLQNSTL